MTLSAATLILQERDGKRLDAPEKLAELPLHVRMFWANLTPEDLTRLAESTVFISELSPHARKFLNEASPKTLEWLRRARDVDIDLLDKGIDLTRSSQTMGRIILWILGGAVAAFTSVGGIVSALNAWRSFKG